jgi:aconitate hydratase 2/2-methylisocitrate dehydratase
MTNIGHFRAAAKLLGGQRDIPVKLWVAPPTKMDESELIKEGHYAAFGTAGARTEMPGCSLCMGNHRSAATALRTVRRLKPERCASKGPVQTRPSLNKLAIRSVAAKSMF